MAANLVFVLGLCLWRRRDTRVIDPGAGLQRERARRWYWPWGYVCEGGAAAPVLTLRLVWRGSGDTSSSGPRTGPWAALVAMAPVPPALVLEERQRP